MRTSKEPKNFQNPVYFWFTWFVLSFIGYQYIQDVVRPNYSDDNTILIYLLGIAPNFLANIGLPSIFIIFIRYFKFQQHYTPLKRAIFVAVFSTSGLLLWEVMQIATSRGYFDWHDILWTLLGGVTFLSIWKFSPKNYHELNA